MTWRLAGTESVLQRSHLERQNRKECSKPTPSAIKPVWIMKKKLKSNTRSGKTKRADTHAPIDTKSSWVDAVIGGWVPVEGRSADSGGNSISIISWNVLADTYCRRRSHPHLPVAFQMHVFDRNQRQHHVRTILSKMAAHLEPDFFALQEVDPPLGISSYMEGLGYDSHLTPSDPAAKDGRVDSCALYYRSSKWRTDKVDHVRLDDLATMCSKDEGRTIDSSRRNSLRGLQSSFVRKNMALLVRLENVRTGEKLVIAVIHLFWNPQYQYVKLCQAHFIAMKARTFAEEAPIFVVGDANSQPSDAVHRYFTKGFVDARDAAPWFHNDVPQISRAQDQMLASELKNLELGGKEIRYLLDFTLNRLCRWLRILGFDTGLETEEEEFLRTKEGKINEGRNLITTSSKLLQRKDCPAGTYHLDSQSSPLELSLVHIFLTHGVIMEPSKFLSRCVVCNGHIERVTDKNLIQSIFAAHQVPESLNDKDLEVFQCVGCAQGYWYDERPTSSASRVKNQATKLLEACIRGGVPISEDMAMFDFIDLEKVRNLCSDETMEFQLLNQKLDVVEWLQDKRLENPLRPLKSAYASKVEGDEMLHFTNVTADFIGNLDYIFHEPSFVVERRLYVPTSNNEMNETNIRNGHLLPSTVWPSDHLAIGAVFSLQDKPHTGFSENHALDSSVKAKGTQSRSPAAGQQVDNLFCSPTGDSQAIPPPLEQTIETVQHGQRCACGCVPNVRSLFEMAELRKKARMKKN